MFWVLFIIIWIGLGAHATYLGIRTLNIISPGRGSVKFLYLTSIIGPFNYFAAGVALGGFRK